MPLPLVPPQDVSTNTAWIELIQTWPTSSAWATRSARTRSALMTVATRPKRLSLATASASCSVEKRRVHITGPKISSVHKRLVTGTSA
ncbi:hypothetical protein D3C80_1924070 [compost metagenome]